MTSAADERDEIAAAWAIRLGDTELTGPEQAELRAWLDADGANGAALEEIAGTWRAVESYATAMPVMALREKALASARMESQRLHRPRWPIVRDVRRFAAIAAMLLLCVMSASYWYAEQPDRYATSRGERRVVVLDDGSRLSLDASTLVRVKYAAGRRQLWLDRGRAKFDVAPDPLRPFSVAADDRVVVATGTSFSVELIGEQVRVALYEGHVSVLRDGTVLAPAAAAATQDIKMKQPGRELVLSGVTDGPKPSLVPIDPVRSMTWQSGMLDFENDSLEVVVARTNRSAARQLVLGDARVGGMRVSGVFRAGDTEALVDGLAITLGVRTQVRGNAIALFAPEEAK
ncbi:FecR family protein [Sphingomonas sp.]|uniref:FecR family protein n=1 Tax=Sphingomonas sp. TaxID=28214 RepID=UPI002DD6B809|nr:FecR domain-containing protein [Sphingomonas sp.]